ncbi:nucleotide sugar dehydrogenase [Geodermatophilus sp. YIM 151500]|uniref:nucleotide sugar dehydrogenase n=1 Tax=Geodermatophilus sp. YIM 151500 TaxID=2984531 RepID=UPI0021E36D21|nr:nucleotide sugar dehydrogenase [Geodermatophilus sp. YIM 151500]MCV2490661.1 nucleotide sugar dehydrogenase [Geodermatophilus sp. YIM 151500]
MAGDEPEQRLAVVGQGYVGLPLAMRAVEVGYDVIGFDVDDAKVESLRHARTYIDDVTDTDLASALSTGRFHPSADAAELAGFDVAVVTVPTPLRDGAPDLRHVESAASLLSTHVNPGCCVILESTTYPGTTEGVFIPLLEANNSLRAGRDYRVGYSPERIDPSNPTWNFRNTPKIVSGIDEVSTKAVTDFYAELCDRVVPVGNTREAELAKLLENTFRHVNIALVNELAMFCHGLGIDVWKVVDAAATKPFGFMSFTPGPGVGGHCLPIDPSYLSWQVRRSLGQNFRFIETANDINDHMPDYVVARAVEHLNEMRKSVRDSVILLIGLSYKRNSGDARQSPALVVARRLHQLGARLRAVDPLVDVGLMPPEICLVDGTPESIAGADLVIVLTDHDALPWDVLEQHADRVLDTRNRLRSEVVNRL